MAQVYQTREKTLHTLLFLTFEPFELEVSNLHHFEAQGMGNISGKPKPGSLGRQNRGPLVSKTGFRGRKIGRKSGFAGFGNRDFRSLIETVPICEKSGNETVKDCR